MIIDSSYFIGGVLAIAQIGQASVENDVKKYIDIYEAEFLQKAMGYELSQSFLDGINVGSDETPEQKWLDLLDGVEFDRYGKKAKWQGLTPAIKQQSPIAAYVYWHYVRDLFNQQAGIGTVKPNAENATVVSPSHNMIKAWNEMTRSVKVLWELLQANQSSYDTYSYAAIDRDYFNGFQNQFGI